MNKFPYRVCFDILKRTIVLLSILYFSLTNPTYAQIWTRLISNGNSPSAPTTRFSHTAVYDTTNNRVIIFGGSYLVNNGYYPYDHYLNDVWVLNNANGLDSTTPAWTQLSHTGSTPTTRSGHTAVYDYKNNRMTVFGGGQSDSDYFLNDVWVLSNANGLDTTTSGWIQLNPIPDPVNGLPMPRAFHTAVYDAVNNQMTIFAGFVGNGGALNDVWVLSNANGLDTTTSAWTQLFPNGSTPTTRWGHTAAYDTTNNRMTIYGGNGGLGNDVWVLTNANGLDSTTSAWTQLFPTGNNSTISRYFHTAVYDNTDNRMMIFGGNSPIGLLNDVWVLTNSNGLDSTTSTWTQLLPKGSIPTTRWGHTAIYDNYNNLMTIFGGWDGSTELNDVWALSNANGLGVPEANFYGSPTSGYDSLTVQFYDTSSLNPTSWNWSFGDGSSSNLQNPSHVYISSTSAYYTVQLIASNSYGTSTITNPNYIQLFQPFQPLEFISKIPDVKLIQQESMSNMFDLNDYTNYTTGIWSEVHDAGNDVYINPTTDVVDYLTPSISFIGERLLTYTSSSLNSVSTTSITKRSTYLLNKLPYSIFKNGIGIENQVINLSQNVAPSIPTSWPAPEVSVVNSSDLFKVLAIVSSNNLLITSNSSLVSPVNVIVSASPDASSDWDKEIVRVYEMLNNYGLFNSSSDTTQWVYENAPGSTVYPGVSYLNTYNGASGVMKVSFTGNSQGIKMTLGKSSWLTSSTGQWYTIRMKVMADSSNDFITDLFLYNGVPGNPFEVSGDVLLSIPTTWTWMETAVYCEFTSSLYPQVIIKNTSSTGNAYIDAIEIIQAKPGIELAYGNTRIANPNGDWQNVSETTGWAFETPYGATMANYSVAGGSLNVSFDGTTTEGIKMTGATAPHVTATTPVTSGKSVGMKMNLSTSGTMNNPIFLLTVFGTDSQGSQNFKELGASASVWYVPPSGQLETSYLPLQPYIYGQIQVKNSGNGTFYLNNTYLQADMDSPYYWDHSLFE